MRAWERRYERWEVREGEEAIKYMHVCVCMCECVRVCVCTCSVGGGGSFGGGVSGWFRACVSNMR